MSGQYRFCCGVWFGHFIVGGTIADNCRSNGWNRVVFVIARHLVLDDGEICVISNLPVDIFLLHDEDFV